MKYSYINSARGIAILMVILTHISQLYTSQLPNYLNFLFGYCQMGVQLFFVASAFTLCNSFENRKQESQPLKNFYIRRFFRIFPIYYLGLILYFTLNYYFKNVDNYTFKNIVSNLTFTHGLIPSANNTIVPGGWSIGTEMLFYLLFPFLIKYLIEKNFLFKSILLIIICYSIIFFLDLNVSYNNFWYFNIVTQLPVIIIGILYYKFNKYLKTTTAIITFILSTIIAGILWKKHIFIFVPLATALSFFGLLKILEKSFLNFPFFQKIGMVSYSIYITHFIFTYYILHNTDSLYMIFAYFLCTSLVCYFLAIFLEKYIEKPFIRLGQKIIKSSELKAK